MAYPATARDHAWHARNACFVQQIHRPVTASVAWQSRHIRQHIIGALRNRGRQTRFLQRSADLRQVRSDQLRMESEQVQTQERLARLETKVEDGFKSVEDGFKSVEIVEAVYSAIRSGEPAGS